MEGAACQAIAQSVVALQNKGSGQLENCFIDFVLLLMGPGILCAHQGNVTARAAVM
jgi:hypothetical protein